MRWKTICFDLDNTLFSHEAAFEKSIKYCIKTFLKNNKEPLPDINDIFFQFKKYSDQYWADYEDGVISPLEYRRKRFLSTMREFQFQFAPYDADRFHELYYKIVDDFSEPYPNLEKIMHQLVQAHIKVGIITNGTVDTQYNKIKKLRLEKWIPDNCIFVSEACNIWKPDPSIFHLAKDQIGHENGKLLFVGDSWEHDVVGAISAGWDSIYLNTRNVEPKTDHEPFAICRSLDEVAAVIKKENKLEG